LKLKNFLLATIVLITTASILNAQPADVKSALKRGDALVAQEQYKAAIEEYNKVSTRDGDAYARATYNIGVCHYELWQTDEAIAFYKRAIELRGGKYPRASYALGVASEDVGKLNEAKLAYQQAMNAFAPAIYRLGLLEANAGEFKKAAALFRDAASREGQHVAASRNNLGVMLVRLGFLKEAEKEFEIALKETKGRFDDAAHNLKLCRSLALVKATD